MYFFALSHAPPLLVIEMPMKRPVTMLPTSTPPRIFAPSGIAATARTAAIGMSAGMIISLSAAFVTMSTQVP